jgi:hypothetical protein
MPHRACNPSGAAAERAEAESCDLQRPARRFAQRCRNMLHSPGNTNFAPNIAADKHVRLP